ncbi:DoxX family protein [Paenibacillus mucilaginosus]|uniref:DoxX family protein n=1 Tax=Paenibacillus mucilaginosus (strain KNP414) TaxID=1036673 RepID=F8FAL4_PAEMK|nr:DoxX family protein [Paenibacillus mucilaginosus]AEI41103.1 DoxX family protein [Paenibacillus mucilaginosus KNP414]MCG7211460.1 DoxX family protein [Paenibacillus mucilaginosus]WDM30164.1 DoxX family protein [Paenibacillus mucilaginosus]
MLTRFLRDNVYAAGLLLILRLYVGYQWFTAGFHKLTGGFDAAGFLKGAIAKPVLDKATGELVYPTFTAFLQNFALPNVKVINFLIPAGETLVGLGLILGALTTAAAFFGLLMNFMFLFAGTVSTNPWLVLLGVIVLMAGTNAGRFGVDRYLMPLLRKLRRQGGGDEAGRRKGIPAKA